MGIYRVKCHVYICNIILITRHKLKNLYIMKAIKTLKFVLVFAAIFSFAGCELVEEPDFETETGESKVEKADWE